MNTHLFCSKIAEKNDYCNYRDTPHHLKNKRVNQSLTDQNSILVLSSIMMKESIAPGAKTDDSAPALPAETTTETALGNGKFCTFLLSCYFCVPHLVTREQVDPNVAIN